MQPERQDPGHQSPQEPNNVSSGLSEKSVRQKGFPLTRQTNILLEKGLQLKRYTHYITFASCSNVRETFLSYVDSLVAFRRTCLLIDVWRFLLFSEKRKNPQRTPGSVVVYLTLNTKQSRVKRNKKKRRNSRRCYRICSVSSLQDSTFLLQMD